MKEPVKILFITQEIKPYLPESEMANVSREFPQYVQEHGCEIRTFMPCYGHINERRNQLHEVQRLSGMNIIIDDTDHPLVIKVASIQQARMQVYFIDNDDFFRRKGVLTSLDGEEFEDNDERAIFYVRGVLETIKKLRWTPDVICCLGWISSLAPLYIKKTYSSDPFFANSKVISFMFNDGFERTINQGFDKRVLYDGIEPDDVKTLKGRFLKYDAMKKIALEFSDAVVFASQSVSDDIVKYAAKRKLPSMSFEGDGYCEEGYRFLSRFFPSEKI
jgi:starch synthase